MLFKTSDLIRPEPDPVDLNQGKPKAEFMTYPNDNFILLEKLGKDLIQSLEALRPGNSIYFISNGQFSNYHILEQLLAIAGRSVVAFTTWAIADEALSKLSNWKDQGLISDLYAILDIGNRNRKEEVFQRFQTVIDNHSFKHIHAKALVVISETHAFTVIGSANLTRNPRAEVGIISNDPGLARFNLSWIKQTIESDDTN